MKIHGFNTLTLLDYPGLVGATLFLGGCNFRCPFCQNGNLVLSPDTEPWIPLEEVLATLRKRRKVLDGVCISGGEPTLYRDLPKLIRPIKEMGYQIKLDTNGTNPSMLRELCAQGLIDFVAMDIKSSPENYEKASGCTAAQLDAVRESADFLLNGKTDYEFRTTVVKELHTEADFFSIGDWISGCCAYYLQAYRESEHVISKNFSSYTYQELTRFRDILQEKIPLVEIRGIE
ncbi:MAG: anaerobic ribonucleoside-triphosphate reductase activating protein [Lachnospiraceae bacterium]|jgi:pyruvate formate lyase activating enzyme|nr:anaerobic ribonucleoside-triphosphate reductase activating protein [Lachnospiraceae bacterium]